MSVMSTRVTPRRAMPDPLAPVALRPDERARVHMIASLLLDYPDEAWFARLPLLRDQLAGLPSRVREPLEGFLDAAESAGRSAWERAYVTTFDLKRKCSLYLSYYATGDTRRRGVALVTFLEAYRAAGWEFDADDLPDFLPAVLEFSARADAATADAQIAGALLASHREGVEVLRAALEGMSSPWAGVVRAVTLSLPAIDSRTRDRVFDLVNEGPPSETVGLSWIGTLPPFRPREDV